MHCSTPAPPPPSLPPPTTPLLRAATTRALNKEMRQLTTRMRPPVYAAGAIFVRFDAGGWVGVGVGCVCGGWGWGGWGWC